LIVENKAGISDLCGTIEELRFLTKRFAFRMLFRQKKICFAIMITQTAKQMQEFIRNLIFF